MNSYTLIAPAKINLYLKILGDRPDGFHELVMIMQSIDLADKIAVKANGIEDFRLFCHHPEVPVDQTNLAYKAARLMAETFPKAFSNYGGIDIQIEKKIPVAAGLAGGSSNGAAVLVGINLIWELGLTQEQLRELAARLGSDLPFSLMGGTALATGRGEILDALPNLAQMWVVLAKYSNLGVSTAWAYNTYRQQFAHTYLPLEATGTRSISQHYASDLIEAIARQDGRELASAMHNDLERVVLPEYPEVAKLRSAFQTSGTLGTMMSGSGPTVFALCESASSALAVKERVQNLIEDPNLDFWIASLSHHGIQLQTG
jgi:4-diphosphocytidyl-2-C-methyl-D-erythritol kinase